MFGFGKKQQRSLTPVEVIDRSITHIGEHGFDSSTFGFGGHQHAGCFIGTFNKALGNERLSQRTGPVLDVLLPELDQIAFERMYSNADAHLHAQIRTYMAEHEPGRLSESLAHRYNDKTVLEVLRELRARVAPPPEEQEKDLSSVPAFPARVGMRL